MLFTSEDARSPARRFRSCSSRSSGRDGVRRNRSPGSICGPAQFIILVRRRRPRLPSGGGYAEDSTADLAEPDVVARSSSHLNRVSGGAESDRGHRLQSALSCECRLGCARSRTIDDPPAVGRKPGFVIGHAASLVGPDDRLRPGLGQRTQIEPLIRGVHELRAVVEIASKRAVDIRERSPVLRLIRKPVIDWGGGSVVCSRTRPPHARHRPQSRGDGITARRQRRARPLVTGCGSRRHNPARRARSGTAGREMSEHVPGSILFEAACHQRADVLRQIRGQRLPVRLRRARPPRACR